MKSTYISMLGIIPLELLTISDDGIGNKICIGIKDKFIDGIFIWWKEGEANENQKPDYNNIDKLADSFEEFKKYLN